MSWKPTFYFHGQTEPSTNSQAFATEPEARSSAQARFARWTMPTDFGTQESDEQVNYRWDDGLGDVMIKLEESHA